MPARRALTPRKRPRQERSRRTVAALLTATAQVLERRGYAAATTDAIAARAGVSVGSLYQYFPNKDALLAALAERHVDEGFARLEALLDPAPAALELPELVARFVDAMLALHRDEPRLHRVLFEEAPLPAAVRRRVQAREDAFAERVAALLAAREGGDPALFRAAAHVAVRTVEGLVHGFVLHPPASLDEAAFRDEVVALVSGYLERKEVR